MTLIVGTLNTRGTWFVVSDRRLTSDGKIVDDSSNKTFIVTGHDFKLICTFTGLARVDGWETSTFLANRLTKYAARGANLEHLIHCLAEDLQQAWITGRWLQRAGLEHRQLAIGLFCYRILAQGGINTQVAAVTAEKQTVSLGLNAEMLPGAQLKLGAWSELQSSAGAMRAACTNERMPDAVQLDFIVEHVRQAAERSEARVDQAVRNGSIKPGSRSTIGDEFTSISLSIDGASGFAVHTLRDTRGFSPTIIDPFGIREDMRAFSHVRPIWIAPPRFRRNYPCPCGRAAQYRHCHGRKGAPRPPVFHDEYSAKAAYEEGRFRFARKQMFMKELTAFFAEADAARFSRDT